MADNTDTNTDTASIETSHPKFLTTGRIVASLVVIVMIASFGYYMFFDGSKVETDSKTTLPSASAPAPGPRTAEAAKAPPDYLVQGIDGSTFRLSQFQGRVVVMDFWATWCGPCQMETPELVKIAQEYGPRGVAVIGLHIDDQGRSSLDQIKSFVKQYGVPYTVGLATNDMFEQYLGTQDDTIPQTLVFGRDGKVIKHLVGFGPAHPAALESAVKQALGG